MYESSNSSTSWPDFGTVSSLNFSHSNTLRSNISSEVKFAFPLMTNNIEQFFMYWFATLISSFGEALFASFAFF